ncbi:MAG: DUF4245 domain-containing protein [Actinomycetota bacterium]
MTNPIRAPRVVAELGRPETPEETTARKAENSRKHRANQTLLNLVLATIASLAVVLFLVLVVVRPAGQPPKPIDYKQIASQSQPTVDATLAVPVLPAGWSANSATIDTGADGIQTWSIGFLTPSGQYIGFVQGIKADKTWISNQLQQAHATGTATISGIDWTVYNQRTADDPGNYAYSLSTVAGPDSYLLHGTATTGEFQTLAKAVTHG